MKCEGWEKMLQDHITKSKPFSWEDNNCALFVADWVCKVTGQDFSTPYRGFKTKPGAYKKLGKAGLAGAATKALGEPIQPLLARRGDVCLIDTPEGDALSICVGSKVAALSEQGVEFLPLTCAKQAWRV